MGAKKIVGLFLAGVLVAIGIIIFIERSMNPPDKQPVSIEAQQSAPSFQGDQAEQKEQGSPAAIEERNAPGPMMDKVDSKTGDRKFLR